MQGYGNSEFGLYLALQNQDVIMLNGGFHKSLILSIVELARNQSGHRDKL